MKTHRKLFGNIYKLLLFLVIGSVDDKSKFGDTANIFDGINESDLQDKLKETMEDLTGFFNDMGVNDTTDSSGNAGEFRV